MGEEPRTIDVQGWGFPRHHASVRRVRVGCLHRRSGHGCGEESVVGHEKHPAGRVQMRVCVKLSAIERSEALLDPGPGGGGEAGDLSAERLWYAV